MNTGRHSYRFWPAVWIAVLVISGVRPVSAQSDGLIHGWFSIVWGDDRVGLYAPAPAYQLTDDNGLTTPLLIDDAVAAPVGGVLALDRHRIAVHGVRRGAAAANGGPATLQVDSISLEASVPGATAQGLQPLVSGSRPFISIMCKFADEPLVTPKNLAFFQGMYGSAYPGLDHYWQEASYNTVNIAGSDAVGWYTLPSTHDQYLKADRSFNLLKAATDCTGVADPDVNFANFFGINMMFNDVLDDFAWGGGQFMTLDGVSKVWPMTWEPPWGYKDITVIAHEMGHAFGLPHSSAAFGQTYDNRWDVMSDTWTDCGRSSDLTYGCLGQGTISYHKDILGWIPAGQKYTAPAGTTATITLEQLDQPQTANYLMAQIPIAGSATHFYTVEVRRQVGYDYKLPGQL